jgi:SAM-dependent methyltransferase
MAEPFDARAMPRATWIDDLLDELVRQPLNADERTKKAPGTYLGWPRDRIFSEVVEYGQAEFDEPIGHLSPEDRARLYALYNMPRHLDELSEAFSQLFASAKAIGTPTVVDLGCGPFTAGLALAGQLGKAKPFRYYGVDRAESMRTLGAAFAEEARSRNRLNTRTVIEFHEDLDAVDFGGIRGDITIAVASYLLASKTLDVDELVSSMERAFERIGPGPVAVLYTNSAKPYPNRTYPAFRDGLIGAGFQMKVDVVEVFEETKNPQQLRYAIFVRQPSVRIRLDRKKK